MDYVPYVIGGIFAIIFFGGAILWPPKEGESDD
jgi:hypothetical protein